MMEDMDRKGLLISLAGLVIGQLALAGEVMYLSRRDSGRFLRLEAASARVVEQGVVCRKHVSDLRMDLTLAAKEMRDAQHAQAERLRALSSDMTEFVLRRDEELAAKQIPQPKKPVARPRKSRP